MPVHQHGSVHCLRQALFFPWATVVKKKILIRFTPSFPQLSKGTIFKVECNWLRKSHFQEANNWIVETRKELHGGWFQAAWDQRQRTAPLQPMGARRGARDPQIEKPAMLVIPPPYYCPVEEEDPERVWEKMEGCQAFCWKQTPRCMHHREQQKCSPSLSTTPTEQ